MILQIFKKNNIFLWKAAGRVVKFPQVYTFFTFLLILEEIVLRPRIVERGRGGQRVGYGYEQCGHYWYRIRGERKCLKMARGSKINPRVVTYFNNGL